PMTGAPRSRASVSSGLRAWNRPSRQRNGPPSAPCASDDKSTRSPCLFKQRKHLAPNLSRANGTRADLRLLIRTSKWAIVARRLGAVAVPLVVLPVLMHRQSFIDSPTFLVVAAFAGLTALLALLVSLVALVRLWNTGDRGWGRALMGLVLGTLCLLPFAYFGQLAWRYPVVTDI